MRRAPTYIGLARAVASSAISASGRFARGGVVKSRLARRAASAGASAESARLALLINGSSGDGLKDRTIVLFSMSR